MYRFIYSVLQSYTITSKFKLYTLLLPVFKQRIIAEKQCFLRINSDYKVRVYSQKPLLSLFSLISNTANRSHQHRHNATGKIPIFILLVQNKTMHTKKQLSEDHPVFKIRVKKSLLRRDF